MTDLPQQLAKRGFIVQKFDPYHYRVNGELDFWFNERGRAMAWWDRVTDRRGHKPEDQMLFFITQRFANPPDGGVPEEEFVRRLVSIGWSEREARTAWQNRQEKSESVPQ